GGTYGTTKQAFGKSSASLAGAILLVEYVLFGAFTATAAGVSLTLVAQPLIADVTIAVAAFVIGIVWLRARQGRARAITLSREVMIAAMIVAVASLAHLVEVLARGRVSESALAHPFDHVSAGSVLSAAALCLFAVGTSEALGHSAGDFPQPKIRNLHRASWVLNAFSLVVTAGVAIAFVALVPKGDRAAWFGVPLASLPLFDGLPPAAGLPIFIVLVASGAFMFALAVARSATNARELLLRLSEDGVLPRGVRTLHPRFGTPWRLIDFVAIAQLGLVLVGAGQLTWIASAYGVAIACASIVKILALVRLRTRRGEARAYRVSLNLRIAGRERPVGLIVLLVVIAALGATLVFVGEAPAVLGAVLLIATAMTLAAFERLTGASTVGGGGDVELLATPVVGADQIQVRPGNLLVPVRRPGMLAHLGTALQHAPDRDVV
ncbi:MAG TPA: APC family permease, partial [Caldimonas sp.]|nr:APC family permease [Caldimonas sp.]